MKNRRRIHNLDTLEKEIYRLQLEVKAKEKGLENSFDYLLENYRSLFMNSFFKRNRQSNGVHTVFDSIFKNEHVSSAISKITDRISEHAADAINKAIDKFFTRKRSSAS